MAFCLSDLLGSRKPAIRSADTGKQQCKLADFKRILPLLVERPEGMAIMVYRTTSGLSHIQMLAILCPMDDRI